MKTRLGGGDALNNCWGINAEPMPVTSKGPVLVSTPFRFGLDEAMKGGGVGMSIRRKHVEKIPLVKNKVELYIACHSTHPNVAEVEPDFTDEIPAGLVDERTDVYVVEDSRQGWGEALARLIDAHFNGTHRVILDFTQIRPYGKKLTFGGRASGPGPLKKFRKINEIINARYEASLVHDIWGRGDQSYTLYDARAQRAFEAGQYHYENGWDTPTDWTGKLRPIDCSDIMQLEGTIVVAGNIRRTAIIILGDEEDRDFVESKNYAKVGWEPSQWRWASNNSISIGPETTFEHFRNNVAPDIYYNGEPGYVNLWLAQNYGRIVDGMQPDVDCLVSIFNPCGEISLEGGHYDEQADTWYGGEPCNLFEISPLNCYLLGFDYLEVCEIGARFAYRVTFTEYEWEMTRNTIEKNRRIGVAITGVTDWSIVAFNSNIVQGVDEAGEPIYCPEYIEALDTMYNAVKLAGLLQAKANGTNPPIKNTTVKPSGSVSLVLGNAPGQHFHWGDWMNRRVTASVHSPIVDAAIAAGYHVEPKILGRNTDGTPNYDLKTAVITFPTKAPTAGHPLFRNAAQVPLWEQAMVQESLATYWADNAVSATLNFHKAPKGDLEAEGKVLDEIARVLDRAKTRIKSTSLLPYFTGADDEGNPYDQLPYEPISEQEYLERKAKVKDIKQFFSGVIRDEELDQSFECQGGHCPIR
jgi:adenosylcobalamin-dependent ribonucleoside-triphosphate reductase